MTISPSALTRRGALAAIVAVVAAGVVLLDRIAVIAVAGAIAALNQAGIGDAVAAVAQPAGERGETEIVGRRPRGGSPRGTGVVIGLGGGWTRDQ